MDISYCKAVTDEGLGGFAGKKYPLESLIINGVTGITGPGLKQWLLSFQGSLVELEAALMDQPEFNSSFMESLATCWDLQLLDLTGCPGIDDDAGKHFSAGEITKSGATSRPGFGYMTIMKLASTNVSDYGLGMLTKCCPNLEHLEI